MNKACPVVVREFEGNIEVLAFKHPIAGNQLVKGTIENGESLHFACARELREESGLVGKAIRDLGVWHTGFENQVWGFCLMSIERPLENHWSHFTTDGGGLVFNFFWQPLNQKLTGEWHALFRDAMSFVRSKL